MIYDVCVIGLGYIGLPTALFIAQKGQRVLGVDINQEVVNSLSNGLVHIEENGLQETLLTAASRYEIEFSSCIKTARVYLICVPTPIKKGTSNFEPDLTYVHNVVAELVKHLSGDELIILESTCPVGTTNKIHEDLIKLKPDLSSLSIAYCPERVLPGNIMYELEHNSRIVGGISEHAADQASDFYSSLIAGDVHKTDAKTAEMCKLTENCFRDVNIAFANEVSMLCDRYGIEARKLISLTNLHPRVEILSPGAGVGGHCIAVDPWFLVNNNEDLARLIRTAREVNSAKTQWVSDKISKTYLELKQNQPFPIILLGISYKPNIDDLRESPGLVIANDLKEKGFNVIISDPYVESVSGFDTISFPNALDQEALFVVLQAHDIFRDNSIKNLLKSRNVIDFCGIFQG